MTALSDSNRKPAKESALFDEFSIRLVTYFLVGFVIMSFVSRGYSRAKNRRLPRKRPFIVLFPKYIVDFELADPTEDTSNFEEHVRHHSSEMGFRETDAGSLRFQRGLKYGDFSAKVAQIKVEFLRPIEAKGQFRIYYGWVSFFDTGDLWKVAEDLQSRLIGNPH